VLEEVLCYEVILYLAKHHAMETWESGGITPHILNVATRGR